MGANDLKPVKNETSQYPLFRSQLLEKVWPYGFNRVGKVNYTTAAYTARYVMKKIKADVSKIKIDPVTGEVHNIEDVYCTMSRGDGESSYGIGYTWLLKYFSDVYPRDYIVHNGFKMKPPRYYDELLRNPNFPKHNLELYKKIKNTR